MPARRNIQTEATCGRKSDKGGQQLHPGQWYSGAFPVFSDDLLTPASEATRHVNFVEVVRGQSLRTLVLWKQFWDRVPGAVREVQGALTEDVTGVATNRFVLGKWLFVSHTPR